MTNNKSKNMKAGLVGAAILFISLALLLRKIRVIDILALVVAGSVLGQFGKSLFVWATPDYV